MEELLLVGSSKERELKVLNLDSGTFTTSFALGNDNSVGFRAGFDVVTGGTHGLSGDHLIGMDQKKNPAQKGMLHIWTWGKSKPMLRSPCPEKLSDMLVLNKHGLVVGGGESGHMYVWEMSTGELLRNWQAHYRTITCLCVRGDDGMVASGGQDAVVKVWRVANLVDPKQKPQAVYTLSGHSQEVCGLVYGSVTDQLFSLSKVCRVVLLDLV